MSEISLKSINQTGLIITLSREIESLMTQLGATEAGLHDKTDHLAPKLPEECVKLLHYIAAVRNKNAHEVTNAEDFDMELFCNSCEAVMEELRQLIAKEQNVAVEVNNVPQVNHEVADVEAEFVNEFKAMMRFCGYLPFFNIIYFAYKVLSEIFRAASMVAGVVFFLMSFIIMTGSLLEKNYQYFYIGAGLFAAVYVYGMILAFVTRKEQRKFNGFAFIPILNFGYFLYRSYEKFKLLPLIYYTIAIVLYCGSFICYYKLNKYESALYCALICYLMGLIGAISETFRRNMKKSS